MFSEDDRIRHKNTPRTPAPAVPPPVTTIEERQALPDQVFFTTSDSEAIRRKNKPR